MQQDAQAHANLKTRVALLLFIIFVWYKKCIVVYLLWETEDRSWTGQNPETKVRVVFLFLRFDRHLLLGTGYTLFPSGLPNFTKQPNTTLPERLFLDPHPTFQMVSDPTSSFSSVFNINFTFVFPSCNCVRLHITMRHTVSFSGIFLFVKGINIF